MPEDWATSVAISISKGKGDIMKCGMYRGVKLLEHALKIVEKAHEKRWKKIVTIDDMQFGFMPGKGTTYAAFILSVIFQIYFSEKLIALNTLHEVVPT